jgi:hypothetical protein
MTEDSLDFHIPNAHNCIESAKYQIVTGNHALAIEFLNATQRSLAKARKPCEDAPNACRRP